MYFILLFLFEANENVEALQTIDENLNEETNNNNNNKSVDESIAISEMIINPLRQERHEKTVDENNSIELRLQSQSNNKQKVSLFKS